VGPLYLVDGHEVQGFDFKNQREMNNAVIYMQTLLDEMRSTSLTRLVVVCGGGDGSLSTILTSLLDKDIDIYDRRLVFSGLPLGTGNDSVQSQGWRSHLSRNKVNEDGIQHELEKRLFAPCVRYDLWRVAARARDDMPMSIVTRGNAIASLNRIMCHYMSIGLQGDVGTKFEENRKKSRWANFGEYAHQSLRLALRERILRLGDFINYIETADLTNNVCKHWLKDSAKMYVELIISNILGIWGRRVPLWQMSTMEPSILRPAEGGANMAHWKQHARLNDELLECYAIPSRLDYFLKQMPVFRKTLKRLGQFKWLNIHLLPCKIHVMLDGDFYTIKDADALEVSHLGQIYVVTGPNYVDATSTYRRR
jgi:hypothetical protein